MSFVLSKIVWLFMAPGNLLVLLLLASAFWVSSPQVVRQERGRRLGFSVAFLLFLIAVFPVGDWLLLPLENTFAAAKPDHVDGILVLGGDEKPHISEMRGQPAAEESAARYMMFAKLAREHPSAKLVFSGGSGLVAPNAVMKDAEVAKQALAFMGVPVDRMVFEDKSRNTHENAAMTAALVHPEPQQKWLLVTSAFHMPRAMGCFRKVGWNVMPAPADYKTSGEWSSRPRLNLAENLLKMTIAMHEYYGLLAYRLMGYTDSLWPH